MTFRVVFMLCHEIANASIVKIIAIGYKEHNDLFIRGQKVEL